MSQFYVGITDTSWYSLLREDYNNGELGKQVNFWTRAQESLKQLKEVLLAGNQDLRMENSKLESRKDRLRMENHDLKQKQLQL